MILSRRALIAGMAAAPVFAAGPLAYTITPQPIGDGIWLVRGADAPIEAANGGAIANITIIATSAGTVLVDCGPSIRYGTALKLMAETLTGKPVVRVYLTHLHPDHNYGDGAFAPAVLATTAGVAQDMQREGQSFSDGMYRLLGDWMRGSELQMPGTILTGDSETIGDRTFGLLALSGHSPADLAILDRKTGTLIAGDLVFHDRAPSTPHADLNHWRAALDRLTAVPHRRVVPGHGPLDLTPTEAIDQTRDWLEWVDKTLRAAVASGQDMVAAGDTAIPPRFAHVATARYEFQRSVSHFYPRLEAELLPRIDTKV